MGRAILLTGRPGVGKTTVLRAVLARWEAGAGGFYTEEIREGGRRTGFRLVTLEGAEGVLASVNISSPYCVGSYGVNLPDLEQVGVEALNRAVRQPGVLLVVVDEIGRMELFSAAFREAVERALDSPQLVLGTVMARSHPWVEAVKARPDVSLIEVTTLNRSTLPEQILRGLLQA